MGVCEEAMTEPERGARRTRQAVQDGKRGGSQGVVGNAEMLRPHDCLEMATREMQQMRDGNKTKD